MHQPQAHFYEIAKYCFNTPNGTETMTVSMLPTEKTVFYPPRIGNTSTLTSSKRTQNRNTPFTTEARLVRQTHRFFFFTGGPSAVVRVCRRTCVVEKLPCNVLAFVWALAQTDCKALATTHVKRRQPTNGSASSLPCQRYDRAPSVYRTPSRALHATAFVLHVQTAELWKSPLALSHKKSRGSLAATVLTIGKTLPEAAPTLKFYIRQTEEAFFPSGWEVFFSYEKMFLRCS